MGFFTKTGSKEKKEEKGKSAVSPSPNASGAGAESNPQEVGIVSGLVRDSKSKGSVVADGDIVTRRFGPKSAASAGDSTSKGGTSRPSVASNAPAPKPAPHLAAVESPGEVTQPVPKLEIDPMAHIGRATTITGDIVAEEDLEIQGTIEGTVQLLKHRVTIGEEGRVKARVDAGSVVVVGRVEGDVVASDLVEVQVGGYIGGNVKAPRVILHDGAIVIGGLDMSAGLPSAEAKTNPRRDLPPAKPVSTAPAKVQPPAQPKLKQVEPPARDELDFDSTGGSGS